MSGFSSLSKRARMGLILCPLLFILLISGFILVARARQMFCFRPTVRQVQDRQRAVGFWERISAANHQRILREDLIELGASSRGDPKVITNHRDGSRPVA